MAGVGGRRSAFIIRAGSHIAIADIGFIPIAAGIGRRIMRGVRRSITDAGSAVPASAGAGAQIPFGRRRG